MNSVKRWIFNENMAGNIQNFDILGIRNKIKIQTKRGSEIKCCRNESKELKEFNICNQQRC